MRVAMRGLALLGTLAALLVAHEAVAHDPGLSSLDVILHADRTEGRWLLNAQDVPRPAPGPEQAFTLRFDDAELPPASARLETAWDGHVELVLAWPLRPGARLTLTATLFERLPLGHRVLARVEQANGAVLAERILSARDPSLELQAIPAAR